MVATEALGLGVSRGFKSQEHNSQFRDMNGSYNSTCDELKVLSILGAYVIATILILGAVNTVLSQRVVTCQESDDLA